jgi:hypothetical protein
MMGNFDEEYVYIVGLNNTGGSCRLMPAGWIERREEEENLGDGGPL